MKIGYQLLSIQNENSFEARDLCCYKDGLPKASVFLWLAIQGRILTQERREKYRFVGTTNLLCVKIMKRILIIF